MILPDSVELWGLVDFPEQLAAAEVAVSCVSPTRKITNNLTILYANIARADDLLRTR